MTAQPRQAWVRGARRQSVVCLLVFLLSIAIVIPSALASEGDVQIWQGFRGGTEEPGVLPDSFELTTQWSRELGTGYSSVAVAGDRLVTLFTSGPDDFLGAFSVAEGKELWRLRLADKYVGHEGSDDGPLSSPMIEGEGVYALGPKGQLVAVGLADGAELWRTQLDDSNSMVPYYGYTSSPLPVDGLVVVLTGGEGRAVSAFDQKTGALKWSVGDDSVTYQTAMVAELGGQRQLVAVLDHEAMGLEIATGRVLWRFGHSVGSARQESAHPTPVDSSHLLLNLQSESLLLKIEEAGETQKAEEVWRSRAFANSLVLPVAHNKRLYGFTGRILSAVDPSTGEFAWRSRGAQALNLSLVDGRLVMITNDGNLVVVNADPEAYREVARVKVLEKGDYADPAFAKGQFFVRNQTHLAAVKVEAVSESADQPARNDDSRDPLKDGAQEGSSQKDGSQEGVQKLP